MIRSPNWKKRTQIFHPQTTNRCKIIIMSSIIIIVEGGTRGNGSMDKITYIKTKSTEVTLKQRHIK
jgi:hypothetical protein